MQDALKPTDDAAWLMQARGYNPLHELDLESRFAIGNGLIGVRGAREVSRGAMWVSWSHALKWSTWPRTYVAGLFDTPEVDPPVPALVPAADWLRVRIKLNGEPLLLRSGELLEHRRVLDLRRGALLIDWRHRNAAGISARVRTLRIASQADRALGLQLLSLEVGQDGVEVRLEAELEEAGVGLEAVRLTPGLGVWRTSTSRKELAIALDARLAVGGRDLAPELPEPLDRVWTWTSRAGERAELRRLVSFVRGDHRGDPGGIAAERLRRAGGMGWRRALADHEQAWVARWACSDVAIEGDAEAQRDLRFAAYHLNSAANPEDEHVSVGARALTGDGYLGHVFWDTEIYLLPFYTITWPEAARAMLMYRYHTLDGARRKAARFGWRGAMYAWESADTGDEVTPDYLVDPHGRRIKVLCGKLEHHITADIAYAVWQYWEATRDDHFLRQAGAEILLETARFWASRVQRDAGGAAHIRGVIGPDEYHENVDDNAFTNCMARWNLRCGARVARLLRECWPETWAALTARLGITDTELGGWEETAAAVVVPFDPDTSMIEQFGGYLGLEEISLEQYQDRPGSMELAIGRSRLQGSRLVKQADVVALFALLPDAFDRATQQRNFEFYEAVCTHESSLSRPMHALVAARLGRLDRAMHHFRMTAATDLTDPAGGSAAGIRIAALGGLWQAAVLGFGGLSWQGGTLRIDPRLPADWRAMSYCVQWRGQTIRVRVEAHAVLATLESGAPVEVVVGGREIMLHAGRETHIGL